MSASRSLFENDDMGTGYLGALDLSRFSVASGARLPHVDEAEPLGPDRPGDPRTGNILLFVREVDPWSLPPSLAKSTRSALIDVYHFVCCYTQQTARNLITDDPRRARDLVIWYSIPFPSLPAGRAVSDPNEQKKLLEVLRDTYGFDYTWDVCQPRRRGLPSDQPRTANSSHLPEPAFLIPEHPGLSEGGLLVHHDAQLAPTEAARRLAPWRIHRGQHRRTGRRTASR